MAQIIHGDIIVLNKIDLVDADRIAALESRIGILKRNARVLRVQNGQVPIVALLGRG